MSLKRKATDTAIGSTSTSNDPLIINELKSNVVERTTQINIVNDPKRDFQEGAFIGALSNKKAKVDSILKGKALESFYPYQNANILNSFRTLNTSPETPEALPNAQKATNNPHPVNRLIKPISENLDAAGKYELLIMYKDKDAPLHSIMSHGVGMVNLNAMTELSPSSFNYILLMLQLQHFNNGGPGKGKEEYYKMTPMDYWKHWTFDGIVESEEMANGGESYLSSGFNGRSPVQQGYGFKVCTVITKGPASVFNYFGDNIEQGKQCYAVIKKHDIPADYYYMLNNKNNMASLSGFKKDLPLPKSEEKIKPFQMSFFNLPKGLPVPREYYHYYDEQGYMRRDAVVIPLGTIFSIPVGHRYKEVSNFSPTPITLKNSTTKQIFNNSNVGAKKEETMLTKLIFDCCDGITTI